MVLGGLLAGNGRNCPIDSPGRTLAGVGVRPATPVRSGVKRRNKAADKELQEAHIMPQLRAATGARIGVMSGIWKGGYRHRFTLLYSLSKRTCMRLY
jgi:hypothetical protein